jgi:hypothetical protein
LRLGHPDAAPVRDRLPPSGHPRRDRSVERRPPLSMPSAGSRMGG